MGYIIPVDAPPPHINRSSFIRRAFSMQSFQDIARKIEAIHALFIFDCCFSGSVLFAMDRAQDKRAISWKMKKPVRQFITAGESDASVPDRSLFGDVLIDGLKGEADLFQDGYITGTELGEYLQSKVAIITNERQVPQYGKLRDRILGAGDFVFPIQVNKSLLTRKTKQGLKGSSNVLVTVETVPKWVYLHDDSGNYLGNSKDPGIVELIKRRGDSLGLVFSKTGYDSVSRKVSFKRNHIERIHLKEVKKEVPALLKNSLGMEFVLVTAGSFKMGATAARTHRNFNEGPEHNVKVTRRFYVGKYEVTQGQWKAVMGTNPSYFKECVGDCPVENVSWKDVQKFFSRLNQNEGCAVLDTLDFVRIHGIGALQPGCYRLPSEAEWEYMADAGSERASIKGESLNLEVDSLAWYAGNSQGRSHEIGKKQGNAWGLHDTQGNVWEWVLDWFDSNFYKRCARDCENPLNRTLGSDKVIRGGSWSTEKTALRITNRDGFSPRERGANIGFRILLTVDP
jgi:formylglycine-generating enzyme required for sulfatase activity